MVISKVWRPIGSIQGWCSLIKIIYIWNHSPNWATGHFPEYRKIWWISSTNKFLENSFLWSKEEFNKSLCFPSLSESELWVVGIKTAATMAWWTHFGSNGIVLLSGVRRTGFVLLDILNSENAVQTILWQQETDYCASELNSNNRPYRGKEFPTFKGRSPAGTWATF